MAKLIKQIYDLVTLATDKGITRYHSETEVMDAVDQGQMLFFRECLKNFPRDKRVRNILLPFEKLASVTITAKVGSLPSDFEHEIEAYVTVSSVDYPVTFEEVGFFRNRIRDTVDPPSTTNVFASIYMDTTKKIEISPQITPLVLRYFKRPAKPVFATSLAYTFTVTSANATAGATYTNNGQTFTVIATIAASTSLICGSTGTPTSSGTLTKASGTGDSTITFSAVAASTQYVYDDTNSTDVEWSPIYHDIIVKNTLEPLGINMRDMAIIRAGQKPILEASV